MEPPPYTPAHEAIEVRPWQPGDPKAEVKVYPTGREPLLWVYVNGQWRTAVVLGRHRTQNRTAYQVRILNLGAGNLSNGNCYRTYQWGEALQPRERQLTDAEVQAHIDEAAS